MCRVQSSLKRYDGIVFRQGLVRRRRKKFFRLARFRMKIDNFHSARAPPGSDLFECEFLGAWQLQERQIFRRRANEDEIVVFCVIQGKQATALDANLLMKSSENVIEGVHRQHFSDSGVVIQDHCAGIPGTVVVAHTNERPADEGRVTEDDPGLLRPGEKPYPENVKSHRQIRAVAGWAGFRGSADY